MTTTPGTTPVILLTLEQYCAEVGATERTVRRWLSAGEVPGARQVGGRWQIPSGAQRIPGAAAAVVRSTSVDPAPQLSPLGGLYTLEDAAVMLNTTAAVVRRLGRAGKLDVGRYGPRGALAVWAPALSPVVR